MYVTLDVTIKREMSKDYCIINLFPDTDDLKTQTEHNSEMASTSVKEILPPVLGADSSPPALSDGTTRLYLDYGSPFAQRVWITRNAKGLQKQIKLVPINIHDRPAWYKNVYSGNKVPALEHNNEIKGESLDLIKYIDANFEGPSLLPNDPLKKEYAEEMFAYVGTWTKELHTLITSKGDHSKEIDVHYDQLDKLLSKFNGPFFLGQFFSLVDIAFIPWVERSHRFLSIIKKYGIGTGRPNLARWFAAMNEIDAYTQTQGSVEDFFAVIKEKYPEKFTE